jgi:hypothetical protein
MRQCQRTRCPPTRNRVRTCTPSRCVRHHPRTCAAVTVRVSDRLIPIRSEETCMHVHNTHHHCRIQPVTRHNCYDPLIDTTDVHCPSSITWHNCYDPSSITWHNYYDPLTDTIDVPSTRLHNHTHACTHARMHTYTHTRTTAVSMEERTLWRTSTRGLTSSKDLLSYRCSWR